MRPIATDDVAWSVCRLVCRSVCHGREPCKTAEPIEMLFEMWTWVGRRNHVLDGVQLPTHDFEGEKGAGLGYART